MGRTKSCAEQLNSLIVFADVRVLHNIEDQLFLDSLPSMDSHVLPHTFSPASFGEVLVVVVLFGH